MSWLSARQAILNSKPLELIINISLFSILALSMCVDSGYSYGMAILALLAILLCGSFILQSSERKLNHEDKWLAGSFIFYFITFFITVYFDGFHVKELDRPSRFLLSALILVMLVKTRMRVSWLLYGTCAGAIGAGTIALYQYFMMEMSRASGFHHTIAFGNDSLMFSLLALASIGYFFIKKKTFSIILAIISAVVGIVAFALSGTRGGWLALPLFCYLGWHYRYLIKKRTLAISSVAFGFLVAFFLLSPNSQSAKRIEIAYNNLHAYIKGNAKKTSTGTRLEMWKSAWHSFKEKPLIGPGFYGNKALKKQQIKAGLVDPVVLQYNHAHNEIATSTGYRGILGLLSILGIYFVPLYLFLKKLRDSDWPQKAFPLSGIVVCLSYMTYGLTQSMFEHNSGATLYSLLIVAFWTASRGGTKSPEKKLSNNDSLLHKAKDAI